MTAQPPLPVMPRSAWYIAAVKKISPAYMIETKRRLFDSDDSASMVNAESSDCSMANSVIAGSRNRLSRRKVRLPVNRICISSSITAGASVTPSRNTSMATSLPVMYSTRVSGFDR